MPRARIRFRDGVSIAIDGRAFAQVGQRPRRSFWTGTSDAYDQFLTLVRRRTGSALFV
jgi:hypothetical protein